MAFAEKDDLLGRYLRDRQSLAAEDIEGIVGEVYSELDELLEETGNLDYASYEIDMPDF
ncbi:hypothetical protein [Methanosarcina horonobensis]|uniref:hypothetical protein n=1 Tax=Methanosarcina horonobensis TaxID=418008 RepID=UPI000AD20EA0|nr:hypothetical protein [Methanosarcina horonobensis]